MANVFGTVASSPILTVALALAVAQRPILRAIALDLGMLDPNVERTAKLGSTITARINTVPAVVDYAQGAGAETALDTDVPLVMDKFKQVSRNFTAAEINACYNADGSSSRNIILEAARPLSVAIANHLADAIVALWTFGNFPQASVSAPATSGGVGGRYVKAAGSMDFNALVDMSIIAAQQSIPDGDRFVALNALGYGTLLKDATVTNRFALQKTETQSGRLVEPVAGFDRVVQHAALNTANALANLVGFFGAKDSIIFATRVPTDPTKIPDVGARSNSTYEVITEPTTGISVLAIETITELSVTTKLVWIYGAAKGNPANGMIITSA